MPADCDLGESILVIRPTTHLFWQTWCQIVQVRNDRYTDIERVN
jgi:hypothetical protein